MVQRDYKGVSRRDNEIRKFKEDALGNASMSVTCDVDAEVVKCDPNDSAPIYIGLNESKAAATTDSDWVIYKLTYSGSNVTQIERVVGAWDSRTGLF